MGTVRYNVPLYNNFIMLAFKKMKIKIPGIMFPATITVTDAYTLSVIDAITGTLARILVAAGAGVPGTKLVTRAIEVTTGSEVIMTVLARVTGPTYINKWCNNILSDIFPSRSFGTLDITLPVVICVTKLRLK